MSGIQLDSLETGLQRVARHARSIHATVHLPRIGHATPNFNWYRTERLLRKELTARSISTYIYYYRRRHPGRAGATDGPGSDERARRPAVSVTVDVEPSHVGSEPVDVGDPSWEATGFEMGRSLSRPPDLDIDTETTVVSSCSGMDVDYTVSAVASAYRAHEGVVRPSSLSWRGSLGQPKQANSGAIVHEDLGVDHVRSYSDRGSIECDDDGEDDAAWAARQVGSETAAVGMPRLPSATTLPDFLAGPSPGARVRKLVMQ